MLNVRHINPREAGNEWWKLVAVSGEAGEREDLGDAIDSKGAKGDRLTRPSRERKSPVF